MASDLEGAAQEIFDKERRVVQDRIDQEELQKVQAVQLAAQLSAAALENENLFEGSLGQKFSEVLDENTQISDNHTLGIEQLQKLEPAPKFYTTIGVGSSEELNGLAEHNKAKLLDAFKKNSHWGDLDIELIVENLWDDSVTDSQFHEYNINDTVANLLKRIALFSELPNITKGLASKGSSKVKYETLMKPSELNLKMNEEKLTKKQEREGGNPKKMVEKLDSDRMLEEPILNKLPKDTGKSKAGKAGKPKTRGKSKEILEANPQTVTVENSKKSGRKPIQKPSLKTDDIYLSKRNKIPRETPPKKSPIKKSPIKAVELPKTSVGKTRSSLREEKKLLEFPHDKGVKK